MKKELLSPAGNMECLKSAIHHGADAVYLAGTSFGARKFAKNFTKEELIEACNYCHLYGVKIYVTVNTIIYEDELEECLKYIEFLYNIGIDALIVQDLGLIKLIRKYFEDFEIHASTQAHTHNLEQIKILEKLGVKRVVLARELSLEEINNLDTNMELEVFIHGALCISYSGECYFSSFTQNRSGNRGECAGLCRCPYDLLKDNEVILKDKYLLSPKELNTTNDIEKIKKSKIYSLKIEGRMKSPEYVGYVTSLYRKLLDNENYKIKESEIFNLKSLYNRGFTKGYLFSNTDQEFISLNSSNHQGVKIGTVLEIKKDKIKIKLTHELNQEDAIRFPNGTGMYVNFLYNEKMKLMNHGNKNEIIYVDNKVRLKEIGDIYLTINRKLNEEIKNVALKKIKIKGNIYAHQNEKLIVQYKDDNHLVEYIGQEIEPSISSPISKERITEVLSKLGNTPFILEDLQMDIDSNIFIPIGYLNEIRRNLIKELIAKRIEPKRKKQIKIEKKEFQNKTNTYKISALARNEEQVKTLINLKIEDIYVTKEELYNKYKEKGIYLRLNRILNQHPNYQQEKLLIGETGSLLYAKNNVVVSDYYLNVVNSSYVNFLESLKVKRVTLSPELNLERIKLISKHTKNVELEVIIYGRIEYMIMKYNLKNNMQLEDSKYELRDKNKRKYPILNDTYTHLMMEQPMNLMTNIKELKKIGIKVFRLELFDETKEEIEELIDKIRSLLKD